MVNVVPLTMIVALGWKSYSSMSRLLASIVLQTARPAQVLLVNNANNFELSDNLLFDSASAKVNNWNGLKDERPSKSQIDFWNVFMRHIGAPSQAVALRRLSDVRYHWIGLADTEAGTGPSQTRLRALPHARNEWVAYFDDDDLMHPRRCEFLHTAIVESNEELDALYHAAGMFMLSDKEAMANLLTWWFDPFVAYGDRNDIPRQFRQLPMKIQKHFATDYTRPLSRSLREEYEKAMAEPVPDRPHVSWKDALKLSPLNGVKKRCAKVVARRAEPPSYKHNRAVKEGDPEVHSDWEQWGLYLDNAYEDNAREWQRKMPDAHVGNQTIVMGWITVRKQIFSSIKPVDGINDDNTYQFWRMNSVCRKTRFNYNVLGLYLKPYFYQY